MEQSIATIIIIAVVFLVAMQYLQTNNFQFGAGDGPLAIGARDSAIQNPQPIAESRGVSRPVTPFRSFDSSLRDRTGTTATTIQPKPGYSLYEGIVSISRVQRSTNQAQEYAIIRNGNFFNRSEAPVSLHGWTVESRKSGKIKIPDAEEIPLIDAATQPIMLSSGGEIIITSGVTTFGRSFRENACTDYFSQNHSFTPSLESCSPIPFDSRNLFDRGYNSECVDFVKNIPRCRIPTIPYEKSARIGNGCIEHIIDTYGYAGCIARFRDDKTFFKNIWRVFLNQPASLFDTLHDRVILRDNNGLIVDEFEY